MTEKKTPFDDLMRAMIGEPDVGASFCNCGTCEEAYVAGRDGALKLLENQCPTWVMQVGIAYITIAGTALLHMQTKSGLPPDMRLTAQELVEAKDEMTNEIARWSLKDLEAATKMIEAAYARNK